MFWKAENITLQSWQILYAFILRTEIGTTFRPEMVTISVRNTIAYKICKLSKPIFSSFYHIPLPNFVVLLILVPSF